MRAQREKNYQKYKKKLDDEKRRKVKQLGTKKKEN